MTNDEKFMLEAIEQAKKALELDEVPIGAVVVKDGEIVGTGFNRRETGKNALYHAEIAAIDEACKKLGGWRLWQCELYVTLEPCPMCAGAIINSRIKRVVYGCKDCKAGSCVLEDECSAMLSNFFKMLRQRKNAKKWPPD